VGLVYRSGVKLDGTVEYSGKEVANPDSSSNLELTYPYTVAFGVEFRPRNDLTTRLNLDVEFTQWSKFEDKSDQTVDYDDVWQFAGGVEHQFFIGAPFRFGFRYQPSYQDKKVTTTAVSFGTGFSYQDFQIDLGGEIGTRSWRQADLFPESYYGGSERSGKDRVKESSLRAMVSVGYRI
jgi:long-subunit fatty acid transport protein